MDRHLQSRSPGSIRILCEAAPNYGLTPDACLKGTGLNPFDLYNAETRVSLAQEVDVIANFLRHTPANPGLGIEIGRRYRPEIFGIWGYAILSSPTMKAALRVAIDFANLSFLIARMDLDESQERPMLTFDATGLPPDVQPFVLARHLTVLANFSKQLQPSVQMRGFRFLTTQTDPGFARALQDELGLNVALNRDVNAIIMPAAMLEMPLPKSDPRALEYCRQQLSQLLSGTEPEHHSWAERVRDAILPEIADNPSMEYAAGKLSVAERTLRRRLTAENTSFREVLSDARLSIGKELLTTANMDVNTAALRLGYSEPSSFVRAFSKRFGMSPGSWRRQKLDQQKQT
ncbi:putative HTH-type transcriptional regulator [Ruegeria sp. THAF57]|uniref:AraC family transcriptional regulator n=1 Tax=Ruegeria sp. THAF57 TaxID=2744555 RepID=UPI0015DD7C39|nr:AraC family transcriptional regulator [Ruegeria sp. THAF57]CAD0187232.1 putative HTH-type transcriptional regulator [Ruegeria sp. THAF57]